MSEGVLDDAILEMGFEASRDGEVSIVATIYPGDSDEESLEASLGDLIEEFASEAVIEGPIEGSRLLYVLAHEMARYADQLRAQALELEDRDYSDEEQLDLFD